MQGGSKEGGKKCKCCCADMQEPCILCESGLGVVGVVLVGLGILAAFQWETFIDSKFQEEMVLTDSSKGVSEWISPSMPLISRIYFWNWTNPDKFGRLGVKPQFQEVGPYVFREKHYKVNMTWNKNGTVSYRWQKFFYFEPDLSNGTLNDNITSVNIAAASVAAMTQELNFFVLRSISMMFATTNQKIFWTHTVRELTFDGVDNSIVKMGSYVSSSAPDKFGLFYNKNGTIPPEYYNMDTGATNIFNIGKVRSVNYKNSTSAFKGDCSKMRGSLGELMPAHLDSNSQLVLYTVDMCRPITYYFNGKGVYNNIPVLEFASTPETVDIGDINPENKCFCPQSGNQSSCETTGFFDLRSCKDGAPIFMSFPHMYLAEPKYRDAIEGLKPDPELHRFYIKVEPMTGVPMDVGARLQMNVKVMRNKGFTLFRNVPDVILPVFWIETLVTLPETHTGGVKLLLQVISLGPYISAMVITLGAILLIFLILRRHCWRRFFKGREGDSEGKSTHSKNMKPLLSLSNITKEVELTEYLPSQSGELIDRTNV